MSYHYYDGGDGRHYCYAAEATVRCQFDPRGWPSISDPPPTVQAWLRETAAAAGDPDPIRLLRRAHAGSQAVDPQSPTKCWACHGRLIKIGYSAWIEARLNDPIHDDAVKTLEMESSLASTRAINERLGATHIRVSGSHRYFERKREAIQWAREEAELHRSIVKEEAATA